MRYNFYDYATRTWNWIDPDFMLSGVSTFTERSGFGSLDRDPVTGVAVISCHQGTAPIHPNVARDIAPGAGIFEYCNGSPVLDGYLWPPIAVGQNQTIYLACVDDASRDNLWCARMVTWCQWETPRSMTPTPPTFPTHSITASKVSNKVCLTWTKADAFPYLAYYRISTDGGTNWGPVTALPSPPAFGPDTSLSYYITSPFPFYDADDQLHIVVDVLPIINDTVFIAPIELWHWCPDNSPAWSRIYRCDYDAHTSGSPGTNATFCCRPNIGEDTRGNLFVAWEQFDTMNVEPRTNLLRADGWVAGSEDNGVTWDVARRLTEPNTQSKRFPCISDRAIPGRGNCDTVVVMYLADRCAGPKAGSAPVGIWTYNPYVLHKISVDSLLDWTGVAESGRPNEVGRQTAEVRVQNPVKGRATIRYSLPAAAEVELVVLDAAGRNVATLAFGYREAGTYSASWDAPMPGVYFVSLTAGGMKATEKLVVTR
jgi:hypothetical protein